MLSRLRLRRLNLGYAQISVEHLTGIPQSRISLIERGFRVPIAREQAELARALKCNIEEIAAEDWPGNEAPTLAPPKDSDEAGSTGPSKPPHKHS